MSQIQDFIIGESRDESYTAELSDTQILYGKFRLALNAVASAYKDGHITNEEADMLVREMVAALISAKIDSLALNAIAPAISQYPLPLRYRQRRAARRFNPSNRFATSPH